MVKLTVIAAALALAGCASTPPPPSPERIAIQSSCMGGNLDACVFLEQMNVAKAQAEIQADSRRRAALLATGAAMLNGN